MIRILGAKRIFTLAILLVLNGLLAALLYLYVLPQNMQKNQELQGLRGKIGTVQGDINRMQIEFDQLADQQTQFDKLRERGFFGSQGRREAELVFEKIQKQAGIVSAKATIGRGAIEDNEEAQKAEHKILVSPVSVEIEAVDDVDVFRYIYLLEQFFPGNIAIERVNLERKADVTGTVLRSISSGSNPQLVSAKFDLLWRTMIPEKDIIGAQTQDGVVTP